MLTASDSQENVNKCLYFVYMQLAILLSGHIVNLVYQNNLKKKRQIM